MLERHVAQVRLLVDVLPDIAKEFAFALKGGTAGFALPRDAGLKTGGPCRRRYLAWEGSAGFSPSFRGAEPVLGWLFASAAGRGEHHGCHP